MSHRIDHQDLVEEIEAKFKLLRTEPDPKLKDDTYQQLADLRKKVKRLDENGLRSFWEKLNNKLRKNYTPQYVKLEKLWKQYEHESEQRKKLASGQFLHPGGQDPSASTATLLWRNPSTSSFVLEPLAATSTLTQRSQTYMEQTDLQQQRPSHGTKIWSQEVIDRYTADLELEAQLHSHAMPLDVVIKQTIQEQYGLPFPPRPRCTLVCADQAEQQGDSGPRHRQLPSDVSYSAVGGPILAMDMPRSSGESGECSLYYNAQDYPTDLATGEPIFPHTSESSEDHYPN